MILGWRPHDLETAFIPFGHGLGVQIGASDPVFMGRYGRQPITETKFQWPYRAEVQDKKILEGDEEAKFAAFLGMEWLKESNTKFKSWEDLKHLRENWEGPLILKGIQNVSVSTLLNTFSRGSPPTKTSDPHASSTLYSECQKTDS